MMALTIVACGGGDGTTSPGVASDSGDRDGDTSPPSGGDDDGPDVFRTVTVEMRGIAFNAPGGGDFLTISLGESVRWVNRDGTPHTATSTSVPTGGKGFNSGTVDPGGEFVFTPNMTGRWVYACQFHPNRMRDAVVSVVD